MIEETTIWRCTVCNEQFHDVDAARYHEGNATALQESARWKDEMTRAGALVKRRFPVHQSERYASDPPDPVLSGRRSVEVTGVVPFHCRRYEVYVTVSPEVPETNDGGMYMTAIVPLSRFQSDRLELCRVGKDHTWVESDVRGWEDGQDVRPYI